MTENGDAAKSDSHRRAILSGLAVVLVAICCGVGAYFIGRSSGEDLNTARQAGTAAGQRKGTAEGTQAGYATGFKAGRERGFAEAYAGAYREGYGKAFRDAGLTAPQKISVPQQ